MKKIQEGKKDVWKADFRIKLENIVSERDKRRLNGSFQSLGGHSYNLERTKDQFCRKGMEREE